MNLLLEMKLKQLNSEWCEFIQEVLRPRKRADNFMLGGKHPREPIEMAFDRMRSLKRRESFKKMKSAPIKIASSLSSQK